MSAGEMLSFLIRVITSWQVIAVTVVLVLYFFLISYVARLHRPSSGFSLKPRQKKEKAVKAAAEVPSASDDEDLGLDD